MTDLHKSGTAISIIDSWFKFGDIKAPSPPLIVSQTFPGQALNALSLLNNFNNPNLFRSPCPVFTVNLPSTE